MTLVGRGNDRGTKEFMCKRWCFFFSWGHCVYCLSWEVRHTLEAPIGCFRCLFICPGRACLLGPAVVPWSDYDSTGKVNKAFKSLIRLNHWTGEEMFNHSLPCAPSKKRNKSSPPEKKKKKMSQKTPCLDYFRRQCSNLMTNEHFSHSSF